MRERLKNAPIGTMARRYVLPSILTVLRPSRRVVVRARTCVAIVANNKCHVVKKMGNPSQLALVTAILEGTESSSIEDPFVE